MLQTLLLGVLIGIANIVPGIGGGMIAAVSGRYYDILYAASNFMSFKFDRKSTMLLIPVAIGMIIGIFSFSNLLKLAYEKFPGYTVGTFLGLILGGLFHMGREQKVLKKDKLFLFLTGLVIAVCLFLFVIPRPDSSFQSENQSWLYLILSGMLGACAMSMPAGIDGSSVLIILGVYRNAIKAISDFDFSVLVPMGLGILIGLIIIVKLLNFLMKRNKEKVISVLLGVMMAGSINIFKNDISAFTSSWTVYIFVVLGFMFGFFVERLFKEK